jgi:hypothetical protein
VSLFDADWFARLDAVLRGDAEYGIVSRHFDARVGFLVGAHEVSARFANGGVCEVAVEPKLGAGWSFAFQADPETWNRFITPLPPPLYQDIFSMIARLPEFHILGDRLAFMQNARAVQRATRLFREAGA